MGHTRIEFRLWLVCIFMTIGNRQQSISNDDFSFRFSAKLNATPALIQDAIGALVMLQLNAIKKNVSEEDFSQIEQMGFTKEQISILWQFVTSKRDFMCNVLDQIDIVENRFRDLEWRLECRISSRSLLNQSIPFITIKFHLDTEKVNENKDPLAHSQSVSKIDNNDNRRRRKKEVIFQTDPNNLIYIINVLEKTLQEARAHRIRNIVKNL